MIVPPVFLFVLLTGRNPFESARFDGVANAPPLPSTAVTNEANWSLPAAALAYMSVLFHDASSANVPWWLSGNGSPGSGVGVGVSPPPLFWFRFAYNVLSALIVESKLNALPVPAAFSYQLSNVYPSLDGFAGLATLAPSLTFAVWAAGAPV